MGEHEEMRARDTLEKLSDDADQRAITVHIPRIAARTIAGPANVQNQGAIDWGYHGLLAYGSNYSVVVIDTKNIQPVQCLDKHKFIVKKVKWQPQPLHKPLNEAPVTFDLASSDSTGHIIVWDVVAGNPRALLQDGNKPVLDMEWIRGHENSEHLLAAIHPPYSLIIWDTKTKAKLWKKTYTETLINFDFDPFEFSRLAFLCQDCILFIDDFTLSKVPSSNGKKFYISTPKSNPSAAGYRGSATNLTSVGQEEKQRTRDRLRRMMKDLVVGENKPKPEDTMTVSECLQLTYHRSMKHCLLLLYPREVLILDLHINQTVGIIPLEKTGSPLLQVVPARSRDVLYCLHESGSVSVKFRRRQLAIVGSPLDAPAGSISSQDTGSFNAEVFLETGYEQKCQSEVIRQTKGSKVLGIACDPISERKIALFMTSSKLVFLELKCANVDSFHTKMSPAIIGSYESGDSEHVDGRRCRGSIRKEMLSDLVGPLICENPAPVPPLRILITGLLPGVASPLFAIRMCPPLTTRNYQQYVPLMAGGTSSGMVQVYNMATGTVEKELAVHSCPVRGIEWTNLTSFMSFAFPNIAGSQGQVKNELSLTDTLTGNSIPLRNDRNEEPPIDMVKVSPLKQYFVLVLKDGPLELWDLKNLSVLRTMPKKFPLVTALEWSPIHNLKALKKKLASVEEKEQAEPTNLAVSSTPGELSRMDNQEKQLVAKEHFVFTDTNSQLYHFTVEGNVIRDCIKVPPESGVSSVTCIAFKNDQIVQGDVDGVLSIWDLKTRSCKNLKTGRGWIKKIRFAPGKGNLKLLVLYSDGVDIIDMKKHYFAQLQPFERISQLKCPKDMVKVVDIDWAASDKPVLATQDGCLRIMDMTLLSSCSALGDYEFQDPVFCPNLLPPTVVHNVQTMLSGQFWKETYSLDFTTEDGFTEKNIKDVKRQMEMLDKERLDSLQNCSLGTVERSLIAAEILGNQADIDFWRVVLFYLQAGKAESRHKKGTERPRQPSTGSPSTLDTRRINRYPHLQPLDSCYDILCDPFSYQKLQLERVTLHESKRGDYELTRKVIERLILLGEMDRAVQLLLETELDNSSYYTDAIKACLVATIQSTGAAQSTIKLVATNLIANGNVWEGIQLLCLIGKGLDACRYLLSYGLWESAVWLAKSVLPSHEMQEIMKKWSDHLWANGQKEKAVLVNISMSQFEKALELLGLMRLPQRAGLLLQACVEFGVISSSDQEEPLFKAVQIDFARYLYAIGNEKAALKLCERLGEQGEKLKCEFDFLSSESS